MWEKIDAFTKKYQMLQDGDAVLVGLSGGADSVCLLRYLLEVQKKIQMKIFAVHVNHLLRGEEAERDARFAGRLCAQWQVPFAEIKKDVAAVQRQRHCSLEEAGRLVRYDCFDRFAQKWECNKIAVAHHKNDLAETMFFRMARGTGLRGLVGIRPVTGKVIRPLLCVEREEICRILSQLQQSYMEDSTNKEEMYSRNYIRQHLLPAMKAVNTEAVEHLAQISAQTAELLDYLEPKFQMLYMEKVMQKDGVLILPQSALQQMHPVEYKEIVRRMLIQMAGSQKDLSSVHVEQICSLFYKKKGKYQELPYNLVAERTEEGVRLLQRDIYRRKKKAGMERLEEIRWIDREILERDGVFQAVFPGKGKIWFYLDTFHGSDIEKNDCVKYFDYDKIKSTLCLRSRKAGDYFIMDKEGRHKSLRRYFIDEKIPAEKRDQQMVLAEGSHILWVAGGRISEAYKVTSCTKRILVVRTEEKLL